MAPTPSPRPGKEHGTPSKTPHSKHRLHFPGGKTPNAAAAPSPLPSSLRENSVPTEHPVEVIGRIRDFPDRKEKPPCSALEIAEDGRSVRVRTDIGYRDFTLDGVSVSADEDLEEFYGRFVAARVRGVRVGAKCTIMMYGPTGAGKSYTMFGCSKQSGIVYRALRDILGEGGEENGGAGADNGGFGVGLFVQVAVLEIYNEEIYDLLSGYSGGGANGGLPKGSTLKHYTTCTYVVLQLFSFSAQDSRQDPVYHVLQHLNVRRGGEKKLKIHSVVVGRIIFSILGFLMLATLIYTILTDGSPFRRELLTPWLTATLIDFYVNVVAIAVWVAHKETTWMGALIWILLFICFGSVTTCAYIVIQLCKLSPEDPFYFMFGEPENKQVRSSPC